MARQIRVVHIITRMILGGAQEDALLTIDGLRKTGRYDVGLITGGDLGSEGELMSAARDLGVPLVVIRALRREVRPHSDLLAAAALRRILSGLAPDIVHTHSSKAGVLGRWAARRAGVPIVIHRVHGLAYHAYETRARNWLYAKTERIAAPWADRIVVVADAMKRQALAEGIGREAQYVKIPTGMPVEPYVNLDEAARGRARRELGFSETDIVVAKVARLFDLKGHAFVLDAARQILAKAPSVKFLFIGGGPLRASLEARARAELPEGAVRFTGLVPPARIPPLLAASDLLVHASLREGLPRVLIQALLAARPVVTFDVDGAAEVVENGVTGTLVEPRDVPGLAEAVVFLASNEKARHAYGQRGRERCRKIFSAEALIEATDRLYAECLEERAP
jgi:glycosyltransferase involved in cell wall biosynthesis